MTNSREESIKRCDSDDKDLAQIVNENFNSMAPKEEDMKKLGKEMDNMPTNSEIEQQGLVPDPSQ